MNANREHQCDVLVVGSGAAGLSLALRVAEHAKVIVLSKGPRSEGSTYYAQGGIAAVFDESDSIESHVEDTQIAGAGLCEEDTVQFIAENAKECVQWLIDGGVPFDKDENSTEGQQNITLLVKVDTATAEFCTLPMQLAWRCKPHCKIT